MRRYRFSIWMVCTTWAFVSAPANAEPSAADKELAKKLYQQATLDMEREAYPRACPQFEASLQLNPQHVRTAISLGTCEDRWGKLLSAWRRFEYAREQAVAQSAADKIVEVDGLMADVRRRTPQVRLVVPEKFAAMKDLTVIRNGVLVSPSDYDKAIPVDPGTYEIAASSPTMGVWKANFDTHPGETADVTIGASPAVTYHPKAKDGAEEFAGPLPPSNESTGAGGHPRRVVGFVGVGLGAAGLVVGSIMGGLAISKNNASNDGHCDAQSYCDLVGRQLRWDAQSYANASTGLFIAGGAILATGIVLVATAPSKTNGVTSFWFGPGNVGVRHKW